MLEQLEGLPRGVDGVRATGTVSRADYRQVIDPMLARARRDQRRVRFLYQFAPGFTGFTPGAAWEDARVGLGSMGLFERCAVVADAGWIRSLTRAFGAVLPCPVRVFGNAEWDEALAWIGAPAAPQNVSHRLLEDTGVLLVEPRGPLSAEDFDAISGALDPWLRAGHELTGLVVHARAFPGWDNPGSLLRHLQFLRSHHRRIRRVALAADSRLAKLAPALVESFTGAEVRHFAWDELDRALEWAGGAAARAA